MFQPITFSLWTNNVLDFVGREDLTTKKGQRVTVRFDNMGYFRITIEGFPPFETRYNLEASYYLNFHEVGINHP